MHEQLNELVPKLRRFAYSLTGSMDDADDLLQSTVERILSRDAPQGLELTKWAFRVCRNLWVDTYRSQKVRQDASWDPQLRDREVVDGERAVASEIELEQVHRAMDSLPDNQRAILSLVAIEGQTYKEVSATLEIPPGTVMSRLARARAALMDKLQTTIGTKRNQP